MKFRLLVPLALLLLAAACSKKPQATTTFREMPPEVIARMHPADDPLRAWNHYLGDPETTQFSSLDQITPENVSQLDLVWEYHCGDIDTQNNSQIQCNPLIYGRVLFGTTPKLKVIALDAVTGEPYWEFNPFVGDKAQRGRGVNRGVNYWQSGDDRRLLFIAERYLYCIDATSGKPVESFGEGGRVDLKASIERPNAPELYMTATSPGVVFEDRYIVGCRVAEDKNAAPGDIRAFDVRTGELLWRFRTIPRPGEFGYETWPEDAYMRVGGANSWAGLSLDPERALVFCPTGSAAYDFWGGNRHGENLFANCLIALNARTGERVWHYQTTHHDIWDKDIPTPPALVTVRHAGEAIPAVAQTTKQGLLFLLHRETGEPLFEVEEVPVPPSDLFGEQAWPTQPVPVAPPPFSRQVVTEEDLTNLSPESHAAVLDRFRRTRSGQIYIPPSVQGTVIFPGFDGGGEWGGPAVDPTTGVLYVNSNEMPWILEMVDLAATSEARFLTAGGRLYKEHCVLCHGPELKGNEHGIPGLVKIRDRSTREAVRTAIAEGKGVMPAYAHLPESDIELLVRFLMEESEPEPESAPADIQVAAVKDATILSADPEVAFVAEASDPLDQVRAAMDVPYSHTGWNRFLDPEGYPAIKPPWGQLTAIDLNEGTILWQRELGEFPELTARGIPPTGAENYGGPVVTAGGVIFIAATCDEMFRAFDKQTGELLWEYKLPAGGYATPATYEVDGRQYVVLGAGGGKMGTPCGDSYVCFALPQQ